MGASKTVSSLSNSERCKTAVNSDERNSAVLSVSDSSIVSGVSGAFMVDDRTRKRVFSKYSWSNIIPNPKALEFISGCWNSHEWDGTTCSKCGTRCSFLDVYSDAVPEMWIDVNDNSRRYVRAFSCEEIVIMAVLES